MRKEYNRWNAPLVNPGFTLAQYEAKVIKPKKWLPVESSAIAAVSYNRKERVLHVLFTHGGEYTFKGIGRQRYTNLIHAESVGKYFNQAIRPRKVA